MITDKRVRHFEDEEDDADRFDPRPAALASEKLLRMLRYFHPDHDPDNPAKGQHG